MPLVKNDHWNFVQNHASLKMKAWSAATELCSCCSCGPIDKCLEECAHWKAVYLLVLWRLEQTEKYIADDDV